jgi:hypothetical protein
MKGSIFYLIVRDGERQYPSTASSLHAAGGFFR